MAEAEIDLEISASVLAWFQAQGDDWQERMSAVLQSYVAARGWSGDGNHAVGRACWTNSTMPRRRNSDAA